MKQKKYFCYEIFKNLSIWSRNGQITYNPCSFYNGHYHQATELNLTDAWNSAGRKKIIQLIEQDQPVPGCHRCYTLEQQGLPSRRLHSAETYEQWQQDTNIELNGPQGLDYSVGNLCNLKCVICGPHNSSQWIPDYQKLYPNKNIDFLKYQKNSQLQIDSDEALSSVKSLHFHGGGEPLLSTAHLELLQRIHRIKGLGDVRVFYNTNGTVTVTDEVLKIWEQCKLIELYFSIDDIGTRFEYQRTGARFTDLIKNLEWYKKHMPHNHVFKVNTVWGYLNFYYLDELVAWHSREFSCNRYGDPTVLIFQTAIGPTKINHITENLKDILLKKFEKYPELIKLVHSISIKSGDANEFIQWIEKLDKIRSQQFKSVAPEWAKLLYENSL